MHNLKFALRSLARSPLHAGTVIAILALGIGANTAIFSVVRSVLLKPLDYPEPERLLLLHQQQRGGMDSPFSWPNFADVQRDNRSFAELGAYTRSTSSITGRGPAEQVLGASVTAGFFRVLDVPPLLGRVFTETEDTAGAPPVVVLRESFWRRKLGGDPAVLGQTLLINAEPHLIIGVLPNRVVNPSGMEFWRPIAPLAASEGWRNRRNQPGLFALGRLRPGVTVTQAQAELQELGARLQRDFPADNTGIMPVARPLMQVLTGAHRDSLVMLMAAVGLLLVIACANVAGLQLVRGLSRGPEFAVRAALGAGRLPLVRLLLVECLVLAGIGGGLGVLCAFWSVDAIRALCPNTPRFQGATVDGLVLAFSLVLSLAVGVLSGVWPAWRATRVDLRAALNAGGRPGGTTAASQWTRQVMVTLQVALTVVLLTGAGLFVRSLQRMARFQYGFDPANLLLVTASVPDVAGRYDTDEKRIAFFNTARDRIALLPGVRSVGLNYSAPLRLDWSQIFDLDGQPPFPAGAEPAMAMGIIDPGYFPTLGLPILQGRNFDATDTLDSPRTVIIDRRMAETIWPGENPIGKVILRGNRHTPPERRRTVVVGVVPTIEAEGIAEGPRYFQAYLAQSQTGSEALNFVVRTGVNPRTLVDPIRALIASVDPDVPAFGIATMEELIARESSSARLYALLVSLFAGLALLLAALGLYGVVAHAVSSRRREIGIRMALGALARQVVTLVVRQGLVPLGAGVVLGLAAALAGGRLVAGLLYQVTPHDPLALGLAPLLLVGVALLACWLPARRAARTDPLTALRSE